MPLFTTSIQQQETASAAGVYSYPQIGSLKTFTSITDEFVRESLNGTGAVTLYTVAGTGTPASTTNALNGVVNIVTTAAANDTNSTRTSGLAALRRAVDNITIDRRSNLDINMVVALSHSTSVEYFFGILSSTSTLTGLPTTARHMGVYVNTAVDTKIRITSANGTSQVTADTGQTIGGTYQDFRLNIIWNGNNSATINLYGYNASDGTYSILLKSSSISALSSDFIGYEFHFFIKTLTTAARQMNCYGWRITVT